MSEPDPDRRQPDELHELLQSVRERLGLVTVAMMLMALAVGLSTAVVFGQLANYFGRDTVLVGGGAMGAAVLGFILGFIAGRKR